MIDPVIALSTQEREQQIEFECKLEQASSRLSLLEHAIYRKKGINTSIFDDFETKISDFGVLLRQTSAQFQQRIEEFSQTMDQKFFQNN